MGPRVAALTTRSLLAMPMSMPEHHKIRRAQNRSGMLPAVFGILAIIILGFMLSSAEERTVNPSRKISSDVQKLSSAPKSNPTQSSH
jgi:hypothetical protein